MRPIFGTVAAGFFVAASGLTGYSDWESPRSGRGDHFRVFQQ